MEEKPCITYKLVLIVTCQLGYFPDAWKHDNRINLKKLGKESYQTQSHIDQLATPTYWGKY